MRAVGMGLLAVLALLLAGCGDDTASDGADPVADGSGEAESSGSGDSGGQSEPGGGSSDPTDDDFPIPRPDGLVLDALADSGIDSPGQRQLYYENDDFDRVVAFYDEWTDDDGGWTRSESGGFVVYSGSDTAEVRSITITPGHDPGAQADGPVTYVLLIASG